MVHWSVTRLVALLVVCVGILGGATALAGAAQAADDEPTGTIQGFLRDLAGNPVPGVDVTATDAEGFSGIGTSDDVGRWEVEVPGPGTYTVELDEETLPDGVAPPTKNPIEGVEVTGSVRTVLFTLGERERDLTSKWDQAAQLTVEGLRFGLIIALGGRRALADLRHHRADELRARRDHHFRRRHHLVAQRHSRNPLRPRCDPRRCAVGGVRLRQ